MDNGCKQEHVMYFFANPVKGGNKIAGPVKSLCLSRCHFLFLYIPTVVQKHFTCLKSVHLHAAREGWIITLV